MSTRDLALAVVALLSARGRRAALRFKILDVDGDTAAHITDSGLHVMRVRDHRGACVRAARMVRAHETAEDVARDLEARAVLVEAVEAARRASLTPEQRAWEDRPVCAHCELRDPEPGSNVCDRCVQVKAA